METVKAAELLRHPHLQPYLAQYTNLSPVFLPVRSEMDSNTKSTKTEQLQKKQSDATPQSDSSSSCRKGRRESINSSSDSSTLTDQPMKEEKEIRMGDEKAEAMESLLELCAQLLKKERFEELAGVLKPFGEEEAVSSRETAIWLTKGLMNIQKKDVMDKPN